CGLNRAGAGKFRGRCLSHDVSVEIFIDRYTKGLIEAGSADIARIEQYRIDDQFLAPVIWAEREPDLMFALDRVFARHRAPLAVHILPGLRFEQPHLADVGLRDQFSTLIDTNRSRSGNRPLDAPRIGARRDDEIVFESFLIAMPDQINAG